MSYQQALEAAGATVYAFEYFGSYQGEWIAKIGEDEYILGGYGSCSGCDAFEAEFGYSDTLDLTPEQYRARLADFGRGYTEGQPYTKANLLEMFTKQAEWDSDAQAILDWLTTGEGA